MNKTEKRQLNLRNKLLAAIAMLLVSSIMMVSSTYAWFTLSTAPEVQGITTTIGANGNLEIALARVDAATGNLIDPTSEMGDSALEWADKNYTWGNLISMVDEEGNDLYGLADITLLPSQLNIAKGSGTAKATLNDEPLRIPTYGVDGRLSTLSSSGVVYGTKVSGTEGFVVGNGLGVRAIGTSSEMSPAQINFTSALNAINTYRSAANGLAKKALDDHGSALASIAIEKVANGTDYKAYVADLVSMMAILTNASDTVEDAIYSALLAMSYTTAGAGWDYSAIKGQMDAGTSLATIWDDETYLPDRSTVLANTKIAEAYTEWNNANSNITAANTALDAIKTKTSVTESEITTVLTPLMMIDDNNKTVTINGYALGEVESNIIAIMSSGGILLQLNNGSGVFDNFAKLTGTINSSVTLEDGLVVKGQEVGGMRVNMTTTGTPAEGTYLAQIRAIIQGRGLGVTGGEETSAINATYGYALDFLFRTNASNSSLLLQTEAAQRIYSESTNESTQGAGSTMTFSGTDVDGLVKLMNSIRIVFTSTSGEDKTVYAIAKLDSSEFIANYKVTAEGATEATAVSGLYKWVETPAGEGTEASAGYQWQTLEGATASAPDANSEVTFKGYLRLYDYTVSDANVLTFDENTTRDAICDLDQNVATGITALVYLDGDAVDNSAVGNSETGIATTGILNLQFASSAALVPMSNATLNEGGETVEKHAIKIYADGLANEGYELAKVTDGSKYTLSKAILESKINAALSALAPEGTSITVTVTDVKYQIGTGTEQSVDLTNGTEIEVTADTKVTVTYTINPTT